MYFDKTISMEHQASAITKACFYRIRNIGRIRSLISVEACKTIVCSLVTSRLDYGNAWLYGTNTNIITNAEKRFLTSTISITFLALVAGIGGITIGSSAGTASINGTSTAFASGWTRLFYIG
ncbi:unnamed protein product [Mytilus coruscus]|uniref:Uncharacterized protein n=1 Tax=Mytilus coruscus TaxID=42192 RepID=A0A6J7ZY08_MYTCO|nr:unnamed protein product [Mytilus coruscus]